MKKEIIDYLKAFFLCAILAFLVILALSSCKKKDPEFKIFEGSWRLSKTSCSQNGVVMTIQFVKSYRLKKKGVCEYEVIGGQSGFSCFTSNKSEYFFDTFEFKSTSESADSGLADDDQELNLQVVNSNQLIISHNTGVQWKMYLSRVK